MSSSATTEECSRMESSQRDQTRKLNGLTEMRLLKEIMMEEFGAENQLQEETLKETVSRTMNLEPNEFTITCLIPLICLMMPENLWSEMTSPTQWRQRFRTLPFWTSNIERESEYQTLLTQMSKKTQKPLARWQTSWLPRLGAGKEDMYLTFLSVEEFGQLIELLKTFGNQLGYEFPKDCTSLQDTKTMCMSSTHVPTRPVAVDVDSWSRLPPSNFVEDDEFARMCAASHSQRPIGSKSLNTYVHRPDMSKKWAAQCSMKDYVVDIHIYEYVLRQVLRKCDWLTRVEHNRFRSYIRTGLPGRPYVQGSMPTKRQFWKRNLIYHIAIDYLNRFQIGRFPFQTMEQFLFPMRTQRSDDRFVARMCTSASWVMPRCVHCGFAHDPDITPDEFKRNYQFL